MIDIETLKEAAAAGADVEVLLGTRQATGTIDRVETEPSIMGLEHQVHVKINGSTIVTSPGMLRLT